MCCCSRAVVLCMHIFFTLATYGLAGTSKTTTTETVWQTKQKLSGYQSYTSVEFNSFTVPPQCVRSLWLFSAYSENQRCIGEKVFVIIQYGSFPVVAPRNETFPPDFNINRSHLAVMRLVSDNATVDHRVVNPLPGEWFTMSSLDYDVKKRIKQKGLGPECVYNLHILHHVISLEDIPIAPVGMLVTLNADSAEAGLIRFQSDELTVQYIVTISTCTFTCNGSCTSPPVCPISVTSRSLALPVPGGNDSFATDCSTSTSLPCVHSVNRPVTDDWQYVSVECLLPGKVEVGLTVTLEECVWNHLKNPPTAPVEANTQVMTEFNAALKVASLAELTETTRPEDSYRLLDPVQLKDDDAPKRQSSMLLRGSKSLSFFRRKRETSIVKQSSARSCVRMVNYGRLISGMDFFNVNFTQRYGAIPVSNVIVLDDSEIVIVGFKIQPSVDNGGTLKIESILMKEFLIDSIEIVTVEICITKFRIPVVGGELDCPEESSLLLVSNEDGKNSSASVSVPYPESGTWYNALIVKCYSKTSTKSVVTCHQREIFLNNTITIRRCVDNECGPYGRCDVYGRPGGQFYSVCRCFYGFRGYGCTDDKEAKSYLLMLVSILLLTLSNLFFLPAIILSIKRRYYTEALVYFYTMFFSTFYHACDTENKMTVCIMPYGVLQFCDFLGSIVSFWVTIITMSRLPVRWTLFAYVTGLLGLAMGVQWDRFSLWTFLVPLVIAGSIMTTTWVMRCKKRRTCYPSRRRWLLFIVPGISLSLVGLIMYAGFETEDNYYIIHSIWHVCVSLCIAFLLPPLFKRNDDLCGSARGDDITLVQCDAPETPGSTNVPLKNGLPSNVYVSSDEVAENGGIHREK